MTDPGMRRTQTIYAIGDIHGRLDLLDRAIAAIERDVAACGPGALTVTVGDYIDRGPQSRAVVDRLIDNPFPTPYVALKGNHEALLESFLANPATGPQWFSQGGLATLQSYGVYIAGPAAARLEQTHGQLRSALPAAHIEFMKNLKPSFSHGRYFFCHAGVRPGVPLERQRSQDLMWIRGEFLRSTQDFGRIVVHGHTPVDQPEVLPNRIGIDTGAFASGRLTCVALSDGPPRFLQV